jgi:drug/metabolite transporter (DMT)-like permease
MTTWLLYVIIAQFMLSVVVLTDRFIVAKKVVSKPIVYTFYVGLLSIFAFPAFFFGVTVPSLTTMWLSIASAVSFILSIYFLYESLNKTDPSEVAPVVGGISALTTFLGSTWFLGENLPNHFLIGLLLMISGMMLISHFAFTWRSFAYLTGAGIFFGISSVLIKGIFIQDSFINGFFWSRMANVAAALALLLIPVVYKSIRHDWGRPNKGHKSSLILGNKVLSAIAFLFILVAIKRGDVTLVNALGATHYVFLFIFAILFQRLMPEYFDESIHKHEILHKSVATALIVIGFFVLFI